MLTNEAILLLLKRQQFSSEDINMAHKVVLAISNIVSNDDNTSYKTEIFDNVEKILNIILGG